MVTLQERIAGARADFQQARDLIAKALATTPDDRITWSPSPTARTPIEIVAHVAWAIKSLNETFDGRPLATRTTSEADKNFRQWERQFKTREQVLDLLAQNGGAYLRWLDKLSEQQLASQVRLPFDLGSVPMDLALTFIPAHTRSHAYQIDYIQTVYADRVWH